MRTTDIIRLLQQDIVDKRDKFRYKYPQIIENMIKTQDKLACIILLVELMDLSLSQCQTIYSEVRQGKSLNEAMLSAQV